MYLGYCSQEAVDSRIKYKAIFSEARPILGDFFEVFCPLTVGESRFSPVQSEAERHPVSELELSAAKKGRSVRLSFRDFRAAYYVKVRVRL